MFVTQQNATESPAKKPKVWEKQQKKKKGAKGGKPGKKVAKVKVAPAFVVKKTPNNAPATPGGEKKEEEAEAEEDSTPNGVSVTA